MKTETTQTIGILIIVLAFLTNLFITPLPGINIRNVLIDAAIGIIIIAVIIIGVIIYKGGFTNNKVFD